MSPVVPVTLKTVTVVGTYLRADGTPLQGTVTFHPPSPLVSTVSNALVSGDVVAPIQPDGTITATLIACDDPTISPTGFTYQVTETFTGAQGRTYNVSLSYLASQPIDLMPVTPSSPNAGNVTYVAGPGVPSGGAAGTLLFKNSVTDYDTSWKTPAAAGVLALNGGTMTGAIGMNQAPASAQIGMTVSADTAGVYVTNTTSGGNTTQAALMASSAATSGLLVGSLVAGDTIKRYQATVDGTMGWGPGNASRDVNLYRGGTGVLKTDNSLTVLTRLGVGQDAGATTTLGVTTTSDNNAIKLTNSNAAGNTNSSALLVIAQTANSRALAYKVNGDSQNRWGSFHDGSMVWGPGGTTAPDTNLYRSAAGVLTTDTALTVGGTVSAGALYAPNQAPYCYGYKAWTCDPMYANNATPGSGNVFLTQFVLAVPGVISTVYVPVIATGSVTAGKNFIGIYNSAGTLISNAVSLDTVVTSTGLKAVAITVNGGAQLAAGLYYVGFLLTGTVPTLLENSNANANLLPSGGPRMGFISTQTTLPASFTPGSVASSSAGTWYFGVA